MKLSSMYFKFRVSKVCLAKAVKVQLASAKVFAHAVRHISMIKVRAPIPSVYAGFYIVYYKDIGEFQI